MVLNQDILIYQNPLSKIHIKIKKKLLLNNKKPNVLIATQDFFDAIEYLYGRFIFNDFYE